MYYWTTFLLLSFLLMLLPHSVSAQENGPNRAGLIVVHGDGRVLTRCMTFTEESISGVALLQRSGLAVDANNGPMGSAVCTINGEGCPVNDCFCECKSTPCAYWNYFHRNADGSWAYSGMGAVVWTLGNGDVDAWVWGDGTTPPPDLAFDAICSAEPAPIAPESPSTAAPTVTPLPPETPIPTPTSPLASSTPAPATSTAAPPTIAKSLSASSPAQASTASSTPIPATATALSPSPTPPLTPPSTYSLSFPVVVSPGSASYSSPSPLRQYLPFALLLVCIVGLALLKRKRK